MASPATAAPSTAADLLDLVRRSGIHKVEYFDEKVAEYDLPDNAAGAAEVLVRGGLLTGFQSRLLQLGKHRGFKLGTYVIRDQLGKGGMGTVYLAEHATLRRKVALKVLAADGAAQKAGVERFLREARAAAALDHPNIVRVFDVLQQGEVHYLVMEYVEGRTLDSLVAGGGAMAPGRAVGYISQAAAGLQHAYEKGFVHRDIKPANLMVAKDGTVKVLDMGLARSLVDDGDRVTEHLDNGAVVGTADFISPEQATNSPGVDVRADIYSLGATLFVLVAGQPPFTGSTSQVLMQHQLKAAPSLADFDRTISPGLAAVVARMLAKKPADRYATPADVISALAPWLPNRDGAQKVLAGLSTSELGRNSGNLQNTLDQVMGGSTGRLTGPPEPKPARGRGVWIAGGSAAAALAAAVGGYLLLGGRGEAVTGANAVADPPPQVVAVGPAPAARPAAKPAAVVNPAPVAARSSRPVVFRFDAGSVPEFRAGLEQNRPVTQVPLPDDHFLGCWQAGATGECVRATIDGQPAFGLASRTGSPSAQYVVPLASDDLDPAREYTLRVIHLTRGDVGGYVLVQNVTDNYSSLGEVRMTPAAAGWQTTEVTFKRPAGAAVKLAFQSGRVSAAAEDMAYVRSIELLDPAAAARPLFRLDPADVPAFRHRTRGRTVTSGTPARLPPGVGLTAWKADSEAEFACEPVDGRPALSLTNRSGPVSAQLMLNMESDNGMGLTLAAGTGYELRFEYKTTGGATAKAYTQTTDYKGVSNTTALPASGEWRPVVYTFDRGAAPLRLLIDLNGQGADQTLYVRGIELAEGGGTAAAVAPPAPTPATPKTAAPPAGERVYALDLSGLPTFRDQFADGKPATAGRPPVPGLSWHCWKKESVAEYRGEPTDAGPALGVTNLNDEVSSQIHLSLDQAPGDLTLRPGRRYVLRVEYRTVNDAVGRLMVRSPDYKTRAEAELASTGGGWKWAEVPFARADVRLHAVAENTAVGEGNTLWVRAAEVYEAK